MKHKKAILLLVAVMVIAVGAASCSETGTFVPDVDDKVEARRNAIETSYEVVETTEEYAGVDYIFPRIEGMINKSKQADANGNMKRLNTKTAKDNDGNRGAISNSYEVLIANDKLFSVIFPTSLNIDIETRAMVMLVQHHKFIYTIDNLFGRVDGNPAFGDVRAVFEAAGADASQSDDDFRKNLVYFLGEDMTALELHITYFTDKAYDIVVDFSDVIDYLLDEKAEMFDFASE
ncbi:MAG: hypothetical protein KAH14_05515 [Clostridiales bacterium]|nr:hypothetical protein [Clostridiales bacterium]